MRKNIKIEKWTCAESISAQTSAVKPEEKCLFMKINQIRSLTKLQFHQWKVAIKISVHRIVQLNNVIMNPFIVQHDEEIKRQRQSCWFWNHQVWNQIQFLVYHQNVFIIIWYHTGIESKITPCVGWLIYVHTMEGDQSQTSQLWQNQEQTSHCYNCEKTMGQRRRRGDVL